MVYHVHLQSFSSLPSVTHSSVPFPCSCLTSFNPSFTSLHFLSHVSVPCLPSSVPYPTALLLVSHPLSSSHCSAPCLLSSVPCLMTLFLVSRPLSHVSVPCLPSSVPNLTSLFLVSRPLSPILSLCSLFHIHLSLSPNPVNCPVVP